MSNAHSRLARKRTFCQNLVAFFDPRNHDVEVWDTFAVKDDVGLLSEGHHAQHLYEAMHADASVDGALQTDVGVPQNCA